MGLHVICYNSQLCPSANPSQARAQASTASNWHEADHGILSRAVLVICYSLHAEAEHE